MHRASAERLIMEADFARDVNDAIKGHREPFDPPEWD
jgi:hypothetical protein